VVIYKGLKVASIPLSHLQLILDTISVHKVFFSFDPLIIKLFNTIERISSGTIIASIDVEMAYQRGASSRLVKSYKLLLLRGGPPPISSMYISKSVFKE